MAFAAQTMTGPLRRWWLIGLLTVLGAVAGLIYTLARPPVYTANAYLVVVAQDPGDTLAVSYAQAYARIADQGAALNAAADASNGTASVTALRQQVQASASPDAPVIEISGSANSAGRAADMANLVAGGLATTANRHATDTRMRLTVLSSALAPPDPTSPRLGLDLAVGAAVGLLLGGLALLGTRDRSDRRPEPSVSEDRPWTADGTSRLDGLQWAPGASAAPPMGPGPGNQAGEEWSELRNGHRSDGGRADPDGSGAPHHSRQPNRLE